jgi:hypothetical protein
MVMVAGTAMAIVEMVITVMGMGTVVHLTPPPKAVRVAVAIVGMGMEAAIGTAMEVAAKRR